MAEYFKRSGKVGSVPEGMAIAASVSMIVTIILSAAVTWYLNTEKISWHQAGYYIMGILLVSSFVGGKIAYLVIKRQRIVVTVMSGVLYWGLLLCATALFFGGSYDAVWETAGIIGAGCGSSALLTMPSGRNRSIKPRKRRVAYR